MRQALGSSDEAILTVPAEKLSWISPDLKNVAFIPVGANFPDVASSGSESTLRQDETPTVAVFGVTGGEAGRLEVSQIVPALRFAAENLGHLRPLVFGRHAGSPQHSTHKG